MPSLVVIGPEVVLVMNWNASEREEKDQQTINVRA
jgi:hypothetical protein